MAAFNLGYLNKSLLQFFTQKQMFNVKMISSDKMTTLLIREFREELNSIYYNILIHDL